MKYLAQIATLVLLFTVSPAMAEGAGRTVCLRLSSKEQVSDLGGAVLLLREDQILYAVCQIPWPEELQIDQPPVGRLRLVMAPYFGKVEKGILLETEITVNETGRTIVPLTVTPIASKEIVVSISSQQGALARPGTEVNIEDITNGKIEQTGRPGNRFVAAVTLDRNDGKLRFKGFAGRKYSLFVALPDRLVTSGEIAPTEGGPNSFTWEMSVGRKVRLCAFQREGSKRIPFDGLDSLYVADENGKSGVTSTVNHSLLELDVDYGRFAGCRGLTIRSNSPGMKIISGSSIVFTSEKQQTYEVVLAGDGEPTDAKVPSTETKVTESTRIMIPDVAPQTVDDSRTGRWFLVCAGCAVALLAVVVVWRKRRSPDSVVR